MDLVGTNANDGTVSSVKLSAMEHKLALIRVDIVVELVEICKSSESWTRDMSYRGQEETIDDESKKVTEATNACEANKRRRCQCIDHGHLIKCHGNVWNDSSLPGLLK